MQSFFLALYKISEISWGQSEGQLHRAVQSLKEEKIKEVSQLIESGEKKNEIARCLGISQ